MVQLLEMTARPATVGFQADMAHTPLHDGLQRPRRCPPPREFRLEGPVPTRQRAQDADQRSALDDRLHVAQNNATVHGTGSHDKTGRCCLATDASGKLDIPRHAGYWLTNESGHTLKRLRHICWDGCMFPNDVLNKQQTWNDISGDGKNCASQRLE
jgi:hypothetical protein